MRLNALSSVIFAVMTTAAGAAVWVHAELDDKISSIEFDRFVRIHFHNQQEILNRLRSIEETLREDRR